MKIKTKSSKNNNQLKYNGLATTLATIVDDSSETKKELKSFHKTVQRKLILDLFYFRFGLWGNCQINSNILFSNLQIKKKQKKKKE